ncbi:hypothetical protein EDD18DRAFT_35723 [Armillaria luteobubalina]|uniref:Uncharacterized protein n=1 Tax=Armillaria luteobubalina TaxID=153913 RepID=A0AA39QP35_9AGAR|nr:hypothetical protein EDD18DRAFT_35723 [Armillaria luteobubalina]
MRLMGRLSSRWLHWVIQQTTVNAASCFSCQCRFSHTMLNEILHWRRCIWRNLDTSRSQEMMGRGSVVIRRVFRIFTMFKMIRHLKLTDITSSPLSGYCMISANRR